ncbi:MAG: AMP-dependent synthetase, partial [Acidimicrobiia bacterium]|nr:AMP-dependent synthetase [Acidimicrobiia bacterium]
MSFDIVWNLDPDRADATNTKRFMDLHGIADYDELLARSTADQEWFWDSVVKYLGLPFDPPYKFVRDTSRGNPWATWFVGGGFNLSVACV